ncbi:MAG: Cys-tRNA(Pro) deacylase [Spirochaetaceae bacterium]|jgi:Cys-tRNA(Pro)/Cys-tRNA(Cys) deacylase|nr:Cys-tRNA(Pro) deacylase [Spirochaetaceae bacterium]
MKTNVHRLLDAAGIAYTTAAYEADASDLSGLHAAGMLGMPPEQVFKTLVLRDAVLPVPGGFLVCCIPAADELDLRKTARASGKKKVALIPVRDMLHVTGYIRGGCSPIGMKKQFPTYIDETAELFGVISISAGARGRLVLLNPRDLLRHVSGVFADLTEEIRGGCPRSFLVRSLSIGSCLKDEDFLK